MTASISNEFITSVEHRNSEGECVRVKCPPGFVGEWQPDCVSVPKCPTEYPGKLRMKCIRVAKDAFRY